jgi:hypothetical protein
LVWFAIAHRGWFNYRSSDVAEPRRGDDGVSAMTAPNAVDEYSPVTNPAALAAAGIRLVSRYLSPPPNPKNLSAAEAAALHAVGISVLLNWEWMSGRTMAGSAGGTQDGASAAQLAEQLGAPHGLTIYYSTDFDALPAQYATIAAYYRAAGAATSGRYRVGVYGHADLIDYLHGQGVVTSEWQTYAWSNGRLSDNADLYQYLNQQSLGGNAVDFDRIINLAALGAWTPAVFSPVLASSGDDEMELIRNTGTGAVIAHLGGGVLNPVDLTTYQVWLDLGRPVTQLQTGPWQHYTNWLAAGNQANIAAIALATEQAISAASSTASPASPASPASSPAAANPAASSRAVR